MRVCIRVFGIVQGVGFRPTVKRHADACDIAGSVSNKGPYVEIFAEGSEECVHSFIKQIQEEPPKRAVILKLDVENVESGEDGSFPGFKYDSQLYPGGRMQHGSLFGML